MCVFSGTTIPSGLNGYGDTSTIVVNNGIKITPNSNTWTGVYSTATISAPQVIDTFGTFPSTQYDGDVIGGYSSYAGGAGQANHQAGQDWSIGVTSSGTVTSWTSAYNTNTFPTYDSIFNFNFVNNNLVISGNYIKQVNLSATVSTDNIMVGRYPAGNYTKSLSLVWLRTRTYVPNGVEPTFTSGAITTSGTTPSVSIAPYTTQTLDDGQSVSFTSSASGGTTPYTYQWYSGSSATCTSDTAISGATSSSYTASPTSTTYYCLAVTSASSLTGYSSTTEVVVNSVLSAVIRVCCR